MARVGLDIDGVLYPFTEAFCSFAGQSSDKVTSWKFYEDWGWDDVDFLGQHEYFVMDEEYIYGDLIGGTTTVDALHDLKAAGHEIVLVTARHTTPRQQDEIERQTEEWLDLQDVPYDELHFERDKTKIDVDYFLDDRFENFRALCAELSVLAFLMDQPWNREYRDAIDDGPFTVSSVAEYVDRILKDAPDPVVPTEAVHEEFATETLDEVVGTGGEVRTTSSTGGEKGVKPERHDLVPIEPMDTVARVYAFGATKYSDDNWRKGYEWGKSYAALQRHVRAFWRGEDLDPESGEPHLAHAVFHCLTLLTFMQTHPQFDTRPNIDNQKEAA